MLGSSAGCTRKVSALSPFAAFLLVNALQPFIYIKFYYDHRLSIIDAFNIRQFGKETFLLDRLW